MPVAEVLIGDGDGDWDHGLALLRAEMGMDGLSPDGHAGWPGEWSQPGVGLPEPEAGGARVAFSPFGEAAARDAARAVALIRGSGNAALYLVPKGLG